MRLNPSNGSQACEVQPCIFGLCLTARESEFRDGLTSGIPFFYKPPVEAGNLYIIFYNGRVWTFPPGALCIAKGNLLITEKDDAVIGYAELSSVHAITHDIDEAEDELDVMHRRQFIH